MRCYAFGAVGGADDPSLPPLSVAPIGIVSPGCAVAVGVAGCAVADAAGCAVADAAGCAVADAAGCAVAVDAGLAADAGVLGVGFAAGLGAGVAPPAAGVAESAVPPIAGVELTSDPVDPVSVLDAGVAAGVDGAAGAGEFIELV